MPLALLVIADGDLLERDGQATTYLVSGRADVPRGLTQDDVVVLSGTVTVDGTVEDDVLVVHGRARIDGTVHGDVTVLHGNARLGPDADVGGDVRTSGTARIAEGANVDGDVGSTSLPGAVGELPRLLWFGLWLAAGLAVLLVGLLAPGPVERSARSGATRPARAVVLGGLALGAAPFALGTFAASLLGLGIALVLGAGLVVAAAVGTAGAAAALGRQVALPEGPRSFLAGWVALGVALALALLVSPILAVLAAATVVAFGLGSLVPATGTDAPRRAVVDLAEDDDEPIVLASFPIEAGSTSPTN
jgi:hypothetical protein